MELLGHVLVLLGDVQLTYVDGFDWGHSIGNRRSGVEAGVFEILVSITVVLDTFLFIPTLLFPFVDLRP